MSKGQQGGCCSQQQDEPACSDGSHSVDAFSLSQVRPVWRTSKVYLSVTLIFCVRIYTGRGSVQVRPGESSFGRSYLPSMPRLSRKTSPSGMLRAAFLPTVPGKRPRQRKRVSLLPGSGANFHARQVLRTQCHQLSASSMHCQEEWLPVGGDTWGASTPSGPVSIFGGRLPV